MDKTDGAPPEFRIARYAALITIITNEGGLIWNRYNVLLAANTVLVAVVGAIVATRGTPGVGMYWALVIFGVFGLVLCWNWWGLTDRGWKLQHLWVSEAQRSWDAEAQRYNWQGLGCPFEPYKTWCERENCDPGSKDWICRHAKYVIYLFALGYLGLSGYSGWQLWSC